MLSVVTWLWRPAPGYRSAFDPEKVNILQRMVARWYPHPHRVLCVTDWTDGLSRDIEVIPPWADFTDVPSPYGPRNPSCYRRLRAFHPDIGQTFGHRFVMLDLDTVIVGDLTPVWQRPEDVVFWGETDPRSFYNGSMQLHTAGARPQVWTRFDPRSSPMVAANAGRFGSDQGWISHVLGPGEARWTTEDGVYSYRVHLKPQSFKLPANAKVVFFHGGVDPWHPIASRLEWVREHYR